ncbi:MAG: epoxyqueuosine reductase, partial [Firmicutes bacterium]|nr:epoxyqueuosine reductase [Bacillota bacterium]
MLTKEQFIKMAEDFTEISSINRVSEEMALTPDCVGMRIFDKPLVGFASADDPIFELFKDPNIQTDRCLSVKEWLPGAKTVIAIFLPASEVSRETNKVDMSWPSPEWIHTRWEGEKFQDSLRHYLCDALRARGYQTCMPSHDDPRYTVIDLVSNWSERHTAYACGLGT